jgi:carboxylate-amine ligase
MSTLPELAAVAALTQTLVEDFSRRLDAGEELPSLQPWFVRENKWRAARYGLDARVIVDRDGRQEPVVEHLEATLERVGDVAVELKCAQELDGVRTTLAQGASYARQLAVADASDGDLRQVVQHLIREFRAGPERRAPLAARG